MSSSSFSSWAMGTSLNTKSYASSNNSLSSSKNSSSEDLTKTTSTGQNENNTTNPILSQHEESTCACTNCAWKRNYAEVMRRYEY
ncbi:hypothetical protein E2P81_ATG00006 [Venturia nashicola]|nr:hypothetical protein E2P81_ATG00006 [Venturia nashicola]